MTCEGLTLNLVIAVAAVAIGAGFQHGYHTGVLNNSVEVIVSYINDCLLERGINHSDNVINLLYTLTVSFYMVGGMTGGCLIGAISRHWGRKRGLYYTSFLMILAGPMMALAVITSCFELLMIGRFLTGVMCGVNCGLSTMYLSEVSPVNLRGAMSTFYQLMVTISILFAQSVSIRQGLGTRTNWMYLFLVPVVFTVITNFMLYYCPESPKYLISIKAEQNIIDARKALLWFRDLSDEEIRPELLKMMHEDDVQRSNPKFTVRELLTQTRLRRPLLIAMMLMMAQQFSGVNIWVLYSHRIFQRDMLMSIDVASIMTIVLSMVSLVMTMGSLMVVDLAGRKTLLVISFSGLALTCFCMGLFQCLKKMIDEPVLHFILSAFAMMYKAFYAIGAGPIPWFMVSEMFDQSARSSATSFAVSFNWFCKALIGLIFPILNTSLNHFVYLLFFILNIVFAMYVWFLVPETKNKHVNEIIMTLNDDVRNASLRHSINREDAMQLMSKSK